MLVFIIYVHIPYLLRQSVLYLCVPYLLDKFPKGFMTGVFPSWVCCCVCVCVCMYHLWGLRVILLETVLTPTWRCTLQWSIPSLKVFSCAFHRILPCLRATLSFSTLIGQGSPATAVAKPGCGPTGHLTPLNCKPSEHSVGEAFDKDRFAVWFGSNYGAPVLYWSVCLQEDAQRCLCWNCLEKVVGETDKKGYQVISRCFAGWFQQWVCGSHFFWETK